MSYNDCGISDSGKMLKLDHLQFMTWSNIEKGIIKVGARTLLHTLERALEHTPWTVPVKPGTLYITVGGAVANDIHGKNHTNYGTFGNHVEKIKMIRSDIGDLICSKNENKNIFDATIGGLGITGVIEWVELKLIKRKSNLLSCKDIPFQSIVEYFDFTENHNYEYEAAWIDVGVEGKFGRGIIKFANHSDIITKKKIDKNRLDLKDISKVKKSFINNFTIRLFNTLYFNLGVIKKRQYLCDYIDYVSPLDSVKNWNNLYGEKGFYQYQCVIPYDRRDNINKLIDLVRSSNQRSALAVIKRFGKTISPGILSFPMNGYTLAMDFPSKDGLFELFDALDKIVSDSGGRIYLAKNMISNNDHVIKQYDGIDIVSKMSDPSLMSKLTKKLFG